MPTIFTHPAVPLALGLGLGRDIIPARLLLAGVIASDLPDLDVIAFRLGIPYASAFGHRGFSHSITFAVLVAAAGSCACRWMQTSAVTTFVFLFVATVSHGVLDSFTNGGMGIAFLWPWSSERYFAPFQFIEVSPIGAAGFLSRRGVNVLASELMFVWLPCALLAALLAICFHRGPRSPSLTGPTSTTLEAPRSDWPPPSAKQAPPADA
jgi:inner membrane protein